MMYVMPSCVSAGDANHTRIGRVSHVQVVDQYISKNLAYGYKLFNCPGCATRHVKVTW